MSNICVRQWLTVSDMRSLRDNGGRTRSEGKVRQCIIKKKQEKNKDEDEDEDKDKERREDDCNGCRLCTKPKRRSRTRWEEDGQPASQSVIV
ncbi:hypothetical protein GQ42DRAFT_10959 [Ramicandelaber brevisporus]|nr:hypothetical protein GQ42DRAFT_10959 [Ramicandelaber brevisporus]